MSRPRSRIALIGRGSHQPVRYFESQIAPPASASATLRSANVRACLATLSVSSRTYSTATRFQMPAGRAVPSIPSQKSASRFCSGVSCSLTRMTSRALAMNSFEPNFGGGAGRNRLTGLRIQVFHFPAVGRLGRPVDPGGGSQCSGPRGRTPSHVTVAKPSFLALAITRSATLRPSSRPALASLG